MVNARSLKTALLVSGGVLALLFVGTVWRFVSRFVSFAVLALLVVLAGYVAYELHAGWASEDETETQTEPDSFSTEPEEIADEDHDTTGKPDGFEDDIDAELERLRDQTRESTPEPEIETDS